MYTKYFGFHEKPFTLTPNPRFIFLSNNHKEAFAHLLYGINNHSGFIELIGEVGTGKTTVLRTLMGQLSEESYRTALIFNPCPSSFELLRTINREFGITTPEGALVSDLQSALNHFLLVENSAGRTVVLVIDEAQNLTPEVLEQIRLVSNLETEHDKLIQIILAGQPELDALLQRPELRQLNQRIAVRYRLKTMNRGETRTYIRHRMEVAGDTGGVAFSWGSTRLIYLYTRGLPRLINILCDRCLLIAYGDERRIIRAGIVSRAIREILNVTRMPRWPVLAAICGVFLLLLVAAGNVMIRSTGPSNSSPITRAPSQPEYSRAAALRLQKQNTESPSPQPRELSTVEREISSYDQQDTHVRAFNAIAERWNANPLKVITVKLTVPDLFARIASKRELLMTGYKVKLDDLLKIDRPYLMETTVRGPLGPYHLAVTGSEGNRVDISPPLFGKGSISKEELAAVYSGTAYLIWRNSGKIPITIKAGEKRFEARQLQKLLKTAGVYNDAVDGSYSQETIKAVRGFQRLHGIQPGGSPGELTLALLYSLDSSYRIPLPSQK